jgi:hypothetical protein
VKELSDSTILVRDNGLFLPVARRLARDAKRVLYFTDCENAYPKINDAVTGDGFPDIERVKDIWDVKNEVDCFVYYDIGHSGEQAELRSQGFPVWGSGKADEQELDRELFMRTIKNIGLPDAPFDVVPGLVSLREFLEDKEDVYIKVSRYRGSFETSHFRSMELDRGLLDLWGVRFGPVSELIRFLVFPNIKTDLEIGCDTYCINGQWPQTMLHGIEWKDKSYFASVTARDKMPEHVQEVLEKYGKVLSKAGHHGAFSMELRVKDDTAYFIDPTPRGGLPSTSSQIALWKNFSEIIWAGAHGELVEPEPASKFSAESIVTMKGHENAWRTAALPDKLADSLMLTGCCMVEDGVVSFPPDPDGDAVGWLVATGNTMEQVVEKMNALADELPDGMDANTETLAYVIKEIDQAQEEGIEFTSQETPEPGVVFDT